MAKIESDAGRDPSNGAAKNLQGPSAPARKKSPGRRWPVVVVVLLAFVWFLPAIVAHSPLLGWILKLATADLNGSVAVQSASLGWLAPVEARGVEVRDAAGKPLLALPSVIGDRPLLKILWNYRNLGAFRLAGPTLTVLLRDDGSNVEDVLAKYLVAEKTEAEQPAAAPFEVAVEILEGQATVADERTGLAWRIENFAAKFGRSAADGGTTAVELSAQLPEAQAPGASGSIAAAMKMSASATEGTAKIESFPLAMLRALAARFAPGTTLTGRLSSEIRIAAGSGPTPNAANPCAAHATLRLAGFSLAAPFLQGDVVRLDRLEAAGQGAWQPGRVMIENATLDCDCGRAALSGVVPLGGKEGFSVAALLGERQDFSGQIDLARLAQLLPATLRLRPDLRIDGGAVQWAASCRPEPTGAQWHAHIESANLTAMRAGRRIVWEKPIRVKLDAHAPAGADASRTVIDQLRCESDFLALEAAGDADNLNATLAFSLQKLAEQLGQFVEFGKLQFAGEGSGRLAWRRTPERRFDANANVEIRGFQWSFPDMPPWREESLLLFASAGGETNFDAATRIDTASLAVQSGPDRLEAKLLEPVQELRADTAWPIALSMQGQLHNWPARLAAWLPANQWQLAGGYRLEAQLSASASRIEAREARFAAAPLDVVTPWVWLHETRFDASAAGSWDQARRRLNLSTASVACPTAAIHASDITAALPAAGPMELAGTLDYQGDAARVLQSLTAPQSSWAKSVAGQIRGAARLSRNGDITGGETTAEIANLTLIDAAGQKVHEPIVRLVARGDFDSKTQTLQLAKCELTSSALAVGAGGRVAPAGGKSNAQLEGKMNYDLERLTALLRPWIGQNIALAGRGESSAWYRGPFSLAEGSAALDLRLGGANLYGFPLGPAEVKASMANGAARIEPLDVAVGKGRIRLAPRVRFAPDPAVLTLPEGPLVERVEINPAMCAQALERARSLHCSRVLPATCDWLETMARGYKVADLIAIFGSIDITLGEVDR